MRIHLRLFIAGILLGIIVSSAAVPVVKATTAEEIIVDKSFHITLVKTDAGTLALPDSTGTTGDSATPVGKYTITDKQANPQWHWQGKVYASYARDQQNGLGVRWIGISLPSYGMHGTNEPFSIGKDASHGCIRHQNADVSRAFSIIPTGISFTIIKTNVPHATESMVSDFLELYDLNAVMNSSRS